MKTIRQTDIAKELGISDAHLSQILSGKAIPGKATCRKFGDYTGIAWTMFLVMPPEAIWAALFFAARAK